MTTTEKKSKKNRYPGVKKRGATWYYYLRDSRRGPDGKYAQYTKGGFTTQKEAWEARCELQVALKNKTYIKPSKKALRELLEYWLESIIKDNVEPTTYENYRSKVKRVCAVLGHMPADDLEEIHFHEYFQFLLKEEGLARSSIKGHRDILHKALRDLKRFKLIRANVLVDVEAPKVEKKQPRFLSEEEVDRFLEEVKNSKAPYYYDVCLFAVATGARLGEVLALKWQDINFEEQILTIRRSLKRKDGGRAVGPTKTKKERSFTYGEVVKNIFDIRWAKQRRERLQLGAAYQDDDYVFAEPTGRCYSLYNVGNFVAGVRDRLSMPDVTFHTTRHTAASFMLKHNVNLLKIQAALGHTSVDMTAHYAHVSERDTDVRDTMDNVLEFTSENYNGILTG